MIGDDVLVEAAQRIAHVLRPSDTVARLGGDEFAVLCEELSDDEDAGAIAERIVHAFGEPFVVEGREVRIGASVGIATVRAVGARRRGAARFGGSSALRSEERRTRALAARHALTRIVRARAHSSCGTTVTIKGRWSLPAAWKSSRTLATPTS